MTAAPALRSAHPTIIAWWDDYCREHEDWHERCRALAKNLAPYPDAEATTMTGFSTTFGGFLVRNYDETFEGWRIDRKHGVFVPHRSTPAGKAIAAEIEALGSLRDPRLGLPGIPLNVMHLPGMAKYGEQVWLEFSQPRADFDPELWTPAKLSELHAAREAVEEAEQVSA